jgi:2-carboxy-D-arabinitol-1-phosphatase
MEYRKLELLWAHSKDAWQALLNELSDDPTLDRVLVAVGHPAIHLALICRSTCRRFIWTMEVSV